MSTTTTLVLCLMALFSVAFSMPAAKEMEPKEDMKTAESIYLRHWAAPTSLMRTSYALGDAMPIAYRSSAFYQPYQSYQPYQYYSGWNMDSLDSPWSTYYKK